MKYITIGIMAALIFGIAVSPALQNGFAYAQNEPEYSEAELKENRSEDSKDRKVEQRQAAAEKAAEESSTSEDIDEEPEVSEEPEYTEQELKQNLSEDSKQRKVEQHQAAADRVAEQREVAEEKDEQQRGVSHERRQELRAEFDEQRQELQNRFADLPEEKQQALQSKLAAMREHRGSMEPTNSSKQLFADMTPAERHAEVERILELRKAARDAVVTDMSQEEKRELFAQLRENMHNSRVVITPVNQLSLGVDPNDIICDEGKELVIRVSNGSPICMGYNSVVTLIDRGIVTYPE